MSSDHRDRTALEHAPTPEASQRELRWQLQQILGWMGVGHGGFRAATGQWLIQLTAEELRLWLAWFAADPDRLPALPLQPAARAALEPSGQAPVHQQALGGTAAGVVHPPAPPRQPPGSDAPGKTAEPEAGAAPASITAEEQAFLAELRRGTTVQRAAREVGLSVQRLYLRRRQNTAFGDAWQAALAARQGSGEPGETETEPPD
jgi:hypothetical protein